MSALFTLSESYCWVSILHSLKNELWLLVWSIMLWALWRNNMKLLLRIKCGFFVFHWETKIWRSLEELKKNFSLFLAAVSNCAREAEIGVWMGYWKRREQLLNHNNKKSKAFYLIEVNSGSGLEKKTKKNPSNNLSELSVKASSK